MPDSGKLQQLMEEYRHLQQLDGHSPQSRGRRFNEFITEILGAWGVTATTPIRTSGEIDVAFTASGVRYILEAKWESKKTDTGHVAKLQKRVRQRLIGTFGILLSMSGYSDAALADVAHGERLEVLLLDSEHLEAMLDGRFSPELLLSLIHDRAAFYGEPYTPLPDILELHSRVNPLASGNPLGNERGTQTEEHPSIKPSSADVQALPDAIATIQSLQEVSTRHPLAGNVVQPTGREPSWNLFRTERGNEEDSFVAFAAYKWLYWILTVLTPILGLLLFAGALVSASLATKIISGIFAIFLMFLTIAFADMAKSPILLEIGAQGVQLFARSGATWLPWEIIERIDIKKIQGIPHLVAWLRYSDVFPDFDTWGGGPRFLPEINAIAVCSLNVLHAPRHQIVRALRTYGGSRVGKAS